MKREKKLIGYRRFSVSPKQNLPPLSAHTHTISEQITSVQPYSAYTTPKGQKLSTCHKFFTLKTGGPPQSPNTDISTNRSILTSQGLYSPSRSVLHSDILERIESYELRIKRIFDFEVIQENFALWEKCFNDILPEVKKSPSDVRSGLVKLCSHYAEVARTLIRFIYIKSKEDEDAYIDLQKKFNVVDGQSKKMSEELEKIKGYKRLEMEQIERELEEIFGKNEHEIHSLRVKVKGYKDNFNKNTVEFLTEIFNSMNQDHDIPEIKNGEFIGLDPGDIPGLLSKKFSLIQKFTAKRITEIMRSKRNMIDRDTQTYAEYIEPIAYDEMHRHADKLQIQLNTALVSIEKYRESFGSKINILEHLEDEKNTLSIELSRINKDLEGNLHTLNKTQFELKKASAELESLRRDKDNLIREKSALHNESIEKEKLGIELKGTIEKLEKSVREKEDKVIQLEKNLAKRVKKKDQAEDKLAGVNASGNVSGGNSSKPRASKFDEREFLESLKTQNTKRGPRGSLGASPGDKLSENSPTEPHSPNSPKHPQPGAPTSQSSQKSDRNSTRNSKSKSKDTSNSSNKPKVITKLGQIDEVESPSSRSPVREVEYSITNPQGFSNKKSREKSRGINIEGEVFGDPSSNDRGAREKRRKSRHKALQGSRAGSRKNSSNFINGGKDEYGNDYESGSCSQSSDSERYGSRGGNRRMEYLKRPKGSALSSYSDKSQGFEGDYDLRTSASNSNSKSVSTEELSYLKTIEFSKAIQYPELNLFNEGEQGNSDGVYVFPYNPNQYFALRGDAYYHTSQGVFHAQPRIPDLKDSYVFQSPFHIKK